MRQENQSNVWILRLKPRIKPTIPENSTEKFNRKTQRKAKFQVKQGQNEFLGKIQQIVIVLYLFLLVVKIANFT
jgi:hypothetical protein